MKLEKIKNQLEGYGYFCYYTGNKLIVGKKIGSIPEIGGLDIKGYCLVISNKDSFTIEFGEAQIVEEEHFSSAVKVINFIKMKFPL